MFTAVIGSRTKYIRRRRLVDLSRPRVQSAPRGVENDPGPLGRFSLGETDSEISILFEKSQDYSKKTKTYSIFLKSASNIEWASLIFFLMNVTCDTLIQTNFNLQQTSGGGELFKFFPGGNRLPPHVSNDCDFSRFRPS